MFEFVGLPSDPVRFALIAVFAGFAAVAVAKIYGLFFMRWKTPFRVGDVMTGEHCEVIEWSDGEGYVRAGGELWRATSSSQLSVGDAVTVAAVDGLMLRVNKKHP